MAAITSNESITKSSLVSVIYPTPALFKIGACRIVQAGPKLTLVLSPPAQCLDYGQELITAMPNSVPAQFLHLNIWCLSTLLAQLGMCLVQQPP